MARLYILDRVDVIPTALQEVLRQPYGDVVCAAARDLPLQDLLRTDFSRAQEPFAVIASGDSCERDGGFGVRVIDTVGKAPVPTLTIIYEEAGRGFGGRVVRDVVRVHRTDDGTEHRVLHLWRSDINRSALPWSPSEGNLREFEDIRAHLAQFFASNQPS